MLGAENLICIHGLFRLFSALIFCSQGPRMWVKYLGDAHLEAFLHKLASIEKRRIMKRLTISGVLACVVLLFVPTAGIGGPAGPPGGLDVNVVNTPLQITGDVSGDINISNTDPIPVDVRNSEPIAVDIGNVDPIPVVTESTKRIPFQYFIKTILDGANNTGIWGTILVPSDKLLVIETASFKATLSDFDRPPEAEILIQKVIGSPDAIYTLETPPSPGVNGVNQYFSNCVQVRIYAKLDMNVNISLFAGPDAVGYAHFSLSGYYLPADSTVLSP